MRTKAVIFSCLKHIKAARIAAEAASRHFDVVLAMDGNEDNSAVEGQFIETKFQRNGNLNGFDACKGIAETLLAHSDSGYVVKIDSDTIVKDATVLIGYDLAGFPQPKYPPTLLGCCYHISERALRHSIACLNRARDIGITAYPEDTIITGYAQTLREPNFKENIIPLNRLGVWHPTHAPEIRSRIANFGIYRTDGNWCHDSSLAAMTHYLNS